MRDTNSHTDAVLTEPHQKHIPGQFDVETTLHSLVDRLREPLITHKPDNFHLLSGSWHQSHHKQHTFVPRVDMRETKDDYYLDIELPGVHDMSSFTLEWTSKRKLLVEGLLERPSLCDTFGMSRDWDKERGDGANDDRSDDCEGGLWGPANHIPCAEHLSSGKPGAPSGSKEDENLLPITATNGSLLDGDDASFSKINTHHAVPKDEIMSSKLRNPESKNPDRAAELNIGERDVGRYMRLFMFPADVDRGGVRAKVRDGLLMIMVPKTWDKNYKVDVE